MVGRSVGSCVGRSVDNWVGGRSVVCMLVEVNIVLGLKDIVVCSLVVVGFGAVVGSSVVNSKTCNLIGIQNFIFEILYDTSFQITHIIDIYILHLVYAKRFHTFDFLFLGKTSKKKQ